MSNCFIMSKIKEWFSTTAKRSEKPCKIYGWEQFLWRFNYLPHKFYRLSHSAQLYVWPKHYLNWSNVSVLFLFGETFTEGRKFTKSHGILKLSADKWFQIFARDKNVREKRTNLRENLFEESILTNKTSLKTITVFHYDTKQR